MKTPTFGALCLLFMTAVITACAASNPSVGMDQARMQPHPHVDATAVAWSAYPIIAHQLRSDEAPIVRWIDTDADGVSNYRLLCTFEDGRVRVKQVIPDVTFRKRFRQARL